MSEILVPMTRASPFSSPVPAHVIVRRASSRFSFNVTSRVNRAVLSELQNRFAVESLKFTLQRRAPADQSEGRKSCRVLQGLSLCDFQPRNIYSCTIFCCFYSPYLNALHLLDGSFQCINKSIPTHRRTTQHGRRLFFPASASTSTKASSAKSAIRIRLFITTTYTWRPRSWRL